MLTTTKGIVELAGGGAGSREGMRMEKEDRTQLAVGSSSDSLGKGAAARFKEESRRKGGSNSGGVYFLFL